MNRSTNDELVKRLLDLGRIFVDLESGLVFNPNSKKGKGHPIGAYDHKGYLRANIWLEGKQVGFPIHRAIWIAANGVPSGQFMEIDHINGKKDDNRLANLDLVTTKENVHRAMRSGLFNGGWRNAPRNSKGKFLPKPTIDAPTGATGEPLE